MDLFRLALFCFTVQLLGLTIQTLWNFLSVARFVNRNVFRLVVHRINSREIWKHIKARLLFNCHADVLQFQTAVGAMRLPTPTGFFCTCRSTTADTTLRTGWASECTLLLLALRNGTAADSMTGPTGQLLFVAWQTGYRDWRRNNKRVCYSGKGKACVLMTTNRVQVSS